MKTKKEIQNEEQNKPSMEWGILEVLIDIRDILEDIRKKGIKVDIKENKLGK